MLWVLRDFVISPAFSIKKRHNRSYTVSDTCFQDTVYHAWE